MANSPFTPSRSALGDISNNKLFRSALKTPLNIIHEDTESIELCMGQAVLPDIQEIGILNPDYSEDIILDYPDRSFPVYVQEIVDEPWQDPGFECIEQEIENFLNEGVKVGFVVTPNINS